jgi:hypothetical protein
MEIDNHILWFMLAAVGVILLYALLVVWLLARYDRRPAKTEYVGMIYNARWDCLYCGGSGWAPDFQERCLLPCGCTSPAKVKRRNKRHEYPELDIAPVSGRAA